MVDTSEAIRGATLVGELVALGLLEPEYTPRQRQALARKAAAARGEATQRRCEFVGDLGNQCPELVTRFTSGGELGHFCYVHSGAKRKKKAEEPNRAPAIKAWWANRSHDRGPLGSSS